MLGDRRFKYNQMSQINNNDGELSDANTLKPNKRIG